MGDANCPSCADCSAGNCSRLDKSFPGFCPTVKMGADAVESCVAKYTENPVDHKIAITSAQIESDFYCSATRAEEILIFAKRMGYEKVGVASCLGLIRECGLFARAARARGVNLYGVACKIGAVDKTRIGLEEERKLVPHSHESMCNPIMQAETLNREGTDFNVIIGLCVGHDTLFIKHSKAPVTYLIVKDRVLCHNPAAALYNMDSYYSRLLRPDRQ